MCAAVRLVVHQGGLSSRPKFWNRAVVARFQSVPLSAKVGEVLGGSWGGVGAHSNDHGGRWVVMCQAQLGLKPRAWAGLQRAQAC